MCLMCEPRSNLSLDGPWSTSGEMMFRRGGQLKSRSVFSDRGWLCTSVKI